jgi:hypothetical protein
MRRWGNDEEERSVTGLSGKGMLEFNIAFPGGYSTLVGFIQACLGPQLRIHIQ